jgi:penicillin-binding protein 1A
MHTLLRIILFLAGGVILVVLAAFCWLYFYSRDLPDVRALAQFAPTTTMQVSDSCMGSTVAIPYNAIGTKIHNAITAVETSERDPGVLKMTFQALVSEDLQRSRTVVASWYVSRTLCYQRSTNLQRQVYEIRTAIQLERRYSRQQLFTMFANRIFLGPGFVGVERGSEFYFHKSAADLTLAEAALLVGLVRSPTVYSPTRHPDRALTRRNEVIDAMLGVNMISSAEANIAKAASLGIAKN